MDFDVNEINQWFEETGKEFCLCGYNEWWVTTKNCKLIFLFKDEPGRNLKWDGERDLTVDAIKYLRDPDGKEILIIICFRSISKKDLRSFIDDVIGRN